MRDLGIDITAISPWFIPEHDAPFALVRVSNEHAAAWTDVLGIPVRRCYIDDNLLEKRARAVGRSRAELLAAKLPERGSIMAGDFGEILVFLYQAAQEPTLEIVGPKKWRLKEARTRSASHTDVVQFALPHWPQASEDDQILCSEVKTKSTAGNSSPIRSAIADCEKDRTGRLAKTLVWLRERALHEDLGTTTINHLERFINAIDHPEARKRFRAVAVVCTSLVDQELVHAPQQQPSDYSVVVIAVPNLKQQYEKVFGAVHATVADPESQT